MGHGNYIDPFAQIPRTSRGMTDRTSRGMTESSCPANAGHLYTVGAGETLDLLLTAFPGESKDVAIDIDIVGEGARVNLSGLYICPAEEQVRYTVRLHHRVPGCVSYQLFKGIVAGEARVRFDGRIIVAPDAQKTEAYQENHNLLLSETERAELIASFPQTEAWIRRFISGDDFINNKRRYCLWLVGVRAFPF